VLTTIFPRQSSQRTPVAAGKGGEANFYDSRGAESAVSLDDERIVGESTKNESSMPEPGGRGSIEKTRDTRRK